MRERTRYLIIAILLTVLDVVVAWFGIAIFAASPQVIWKWTMLMSTVPACAASLANMWIQIFPELLGVISEYESRRTDWDSFAAPVPAEGLEESDV